MSTSTAGEQAIMQFLQNISNENKELRADVARLSNQINTMEQTQAFDNGFDTRARDLLRLMQSAAQEDVHLAIDSITETVSSEVSKVEKSVLQGHQILRDEIASVRREIRCLQPRDDDVKFTLFPRLPIELRLKIWKTACFQEPRVCHLGMHCEPVGVEDVPELYCPGGFPQPSVLFACRESRSEASRHYKIAMMNFWTPLFAKPSKYLMVYINYSIDILFLNLDKRWEEIFPPTLYNWAQVVTEELRQFSVNPVPFHRFRRVAIEESVSVDWMISALYLSEPKSEIEEVIVVHNKRQLPLGTTDMRLEPMAETERVEHPNEELSGAPVTVARAREWISINLMAPKKHGIKRHQWDAEVPEDSARIIRDKLPPTVTFAKSKTQNPLPRPRIFIDS